MQRRKVLKLIGFLPLVGSSIALGASQVDPQGREANEEYFRLTWWPPHLSKDPLVLTAQWTPWVSDDGDSKLTVSTLKVLKPSEHGSNELFKCAEAGRFVCAMPLGGTTMLATVWLGATRYLIKVLRFEKGKIRVVLEERSHTFEYFHDQGGDSVRIVTTDSYGFPDDLKKWKARVFAWEGDRFKLKKQCRYADRLSS